MRTKKGLGLTVKHKVLIHLLDHRPLEGIGRVGIAPAAISQKLFAPLVCNRVGDQVNFIKTSNSALK